MKVNVPSLIAAAALLCAGPLLAANIVSSEKFEKQFTLDVGGEFWIDNPVGNIDIVGVDGPGLFVSVQKVTTAVDQVALKEAREQTQVAVGGDQQVRVIRTVLPPLRNPRWSSNVSYVIRLPRTVHVKVASNSSDHIHVSNITGNVTVKNVNGSILLDGIAGASVIDSVNGNIVDDLTVRPQVNAQLSTINGQIEVRAPADSNFEWIANTIQGDFLTSFPVRGGFDGSIYRGSINAPGGPTITTATMMGSVRLLRKGAAVAEARSVRVQHASDTVPLPSQQMGYRVVQLPFVQGDWTYSTNLGDISVGEVRGDAHVETGAGKIHIGTVMGVANVTTNGGPLDLGDIYGALVARTHAGDVFVRAAREGGQIGTDGGSIRLLYTGGPVNLHSGGGDVIVRQASGASVQADTRSGDITITVDPNLKTEKIDAKTTRGNVVINVSPKFAGDIDATVLTADPDSKSIYSDFSGLTIRREQVGTKTRIHATGRVNGGGERLELYAEEGDIHISTQTASPITLMTPQ